MTMTYFRNDLQAEYILRARPLMDLSRCFLLTNLDICVKDEKLALGKALAIRDPIQRLKAIVSIRRDAGDRVAQMVLSCYQAVEFVEEELTDSRRGDNGLGSTGV